MSSLFVSYSYLPIVVVEVVVELVVRVVVVVVEVIGILSVVIKLTIDGDSTSILVFVGFICFRDETLISFELT